MRSLTVLSSLLLTSALYGSAQAAQVPPLAEHLPAGALMTFETRNAGSLIARVGKLVGAVALGETEGAGALTGMVGSVLGQDATVGVFTVTGARGTFAPALLAVARPNAEGRKLLAAMMPKKKGAKVGVYPFVRSEDDLFIGQAEGVAYASTDKSLLMAYLSRLSGKDAPRLLNSAAYTTPMRSVGGQEARMFVNFSAAAKVARSALAEWHVPRLLSPVVDALDTLGQWAGGMSTTVQGWSTVSAHLPNPQGRDRPLYALLTPTTTFRVQELIPADAEAVQASACHPGAGSYLGRWLTRVDLLDPLGFLTDTQLASHLERSGQYLGGECAQVTLAGGTKAGFNMSDPAAGLGYTVWYQRVDDLDAARAHLPEFARSVNAALGALPGTLRGMASGAGSAVSAGGKTRLPGAAAGAMAEGLGELDAALKNLKFSYGFRGDYLIVGLSDAAVQKALKEGGEGLLGSADFRAANLSMTGGGWQYARNLPDLTEKDMAAMMFGADEEADIMMEMFGDVYADVLNRYDGMSAQRTVSALPSGHLILTKSRVKFRW